MSKLGNLKIIEYENDKGSENLNPAAENEGRTIAKAAFYVYRTLGAGLDLDIYKQCFHEELKNRGVTVSSNVPVSIQFRNKIIDPAIYIDFLVEGEIAVFVEAEPKTPSHKMKLGSALRLSGKTEALLLNFHAEDPKHLIMRATTRPDQAATNKDAANSLLN